MKEKAFNNYEKQRKKQQNNVKEKLKWIEEKKLKEHVTLVEKF